MKNKKLFEYIIETVFASGGDGDSLVCFTMQNYRDVAEEFLRYVTETVEFDPIMGEWHLEEWNGAVNVRRDQEQFSFSNRAYYEELIEERTKTGIYRHDVEILTY